MQCIAHQNNTVSTALQQAPVVAPQCDLSLLAIYLLVGHEQFALTPLCISHCRGRTSLLTLLEMGSANQTYCAISEPSWHLLEFKPPENMHSVNV